MQVLWLTPDKPDDISVGRQRLVEHLRERDIRVTLRGTTLRTVSEILLSSESYNAIIGTTRSGAIAGSLLQYRFGCPLVIDHVDPISQFTETNPWWLASTVRLLENGAFRTGSQALYVYEKEYERLCSRIPCQKTKLGVEFDRFANPNDSIQQRTREALSSYDLDDNIAIYIGGLEPLYNIRPMMESVDYISDWSLLIFGTGSLEEAVRSNAEEDPSIVFYGTAPHELIPGFLYHADVGLSLVDDPHTLKLLEYAAAGIPPVALEGDVRERFGDLITYSTLDPQDISQNIQRASTRTNTEDLQKFASDFDWSEIADDYEYVLREVLDSNRD